jgi:hypothetical protein
MILGGNGQHQHELRPQRQESQLSEEADYGEEEEDIESLLMRGGFMSRDSRLLANYINGGRS